MRKCAKYGKVMMSDLRLKVNGGGYGIVVHVDEKQKAKIIDDVKEEIKDKISKLYEKYKETNINLDTNRNYDEIKNDLIIATEFFKKYNYKFYREIEFKEGCISHCGYPDYMWQSGAERNIYKISSNS